MQLACRLNYWGVKTSAILQSVILNDAPNGDIDCILSLLALERGLLHIRAEDVYTLSEHDKRRHSIP